MLKAFQLQEPGGESADTPGIFQNAFTPEPEGKQSAVWDISAGSPSLESRVCLDPSGI